MRSQRSSIGIRGLDQRNQAWLNLDLRIAKGIRVGSDLELQLTAEIFNVLNDGTLDIDNVTLSENGNTGAITEEQSGGRRFGRRWQLGLRLSF